MAIGHGPHSDIRPAELTSAHAETELERLEGVVAAMAGRDPNVKAALAMLPSGAQIDSVTWVGEVAHVDLTLGTAEFEPTALEVEFIARLLSEAIDPNLNFGGVLVRARLEAHDEYQSLDEYFPAFPVVEYPPLREDAVVIESEAALGGDDGELRATTFANAGHQPTGALSGVVVYAAAGHGWTSGTSSWFLQRPLLLDMVEDYGNIEQLNYFVNYAFNAGATVVPFRPVGYQPLEVVLDQDDPGVTYTGSWFNSGSAPYYENGVTLSGVNYRFATTSATETAVARYTPNLPEAGSYPVYTWVLDSSNRARQLYRVVHSGGATEVIVDHRMVGRGWVWLGNYYFEAGTGGYVEISNKSDDLGANVIADAIRFGNGIGDVVGPGPGTVSGFPRDEEAQRYWAESETGINAVGMPSTIYTTGSNHNNQNVGTAARWAREMNNASFNNDRWRRIYLEFHSNAAGCEGGPPCGAQGTVALVTSSPTTNQVAYATILGDEIEMDMQILDSGFEFTWGSRNNPFNGGFGAISTSNNSNEFDATILEVAFHDNAADAAMLLDPKVRDAVARSSVQGMIKFLNTLPGSTIPLAFLPVQPENFRAVHNGSGLVLLSWTAPPTGEALGQAATGYRVYRSTNGYGFDAGTDVGNVLTVALDDVPAGVTTFFRVAAYNAGGESMPTETLAVRRAEVGLSSVLIVNGFDRVSRQQNPRQFLPGLGTQRRPIIQKVNSFDYVVQHAQALAAAGTTFDSCANEVVRDGGILLKNYVALDWISGEESSADSTFDAQEQAVVTDYLNAGGQIFASGAEIGWDLDNLNNGKVFYNNMLKASYVGDDSNTYNVVVSGASIFAGILPFSFDNGALFYDVDFPDRLGTFGGSVTALNYSGGTGGPAGIVFDGSFRVVNFGFPFETITSAARRGDVMAAIADFFELGSDGVLPGELVVESRDAVGTITFAPTYDEAGGLLSDNGNKSTASDLVGSGVRYITYDLPNLGTDSATFTPYVPVGGKYEVFVTWGSNANASNARFTVSHFNGEDVQLLSQIPTALGASNNANQWISLGEFWFAEGQDEQDASVNISEETVDGSPTGGLPRRVYVDAARWVRVREFPNGDTNDDQQVTLADYSVMADCISGPGGGYNFPACEDFDFDVDGDVDLDDCQAFQNVFE